jgi:hypothetical protein
MRRSSRAALSVVLLSSVTSGFMIAALVAAFSPALAQTDSDISGGSVEASSSSRVAPPVDGADADTSSRAASLQRVGTVTGTSSNQGAKSQQPVAKPGSSVMGAPQR